MAKIYLEFCFDFAEILMKKRKLPLIILYEARTFRIKYCGKACLSEVYDMENQNSLPIKCEKFRNKFCLANFSCIFLFLAKTATPIHILQAQHYLDNITATYITEHTTSTH